MADGYLGALLSSPSEIYPAKIPVGPRGKGSVEGGREGVVGDLGDGRCGQEREV